MMQIDTAILITYGAVTRKVKKGEIIFTEGSVARFFHQVVEGGVKVFISNSDGKELIQGLFYQGDSFGEPPLFIQKPYPSRAVALVDSVILRLVKESFFAVLDDYPAIAHSMLTVFAHRIYNKAGTAQILTSHTPEEKILVFLQKVKDTANAEGPFLIPYTRQQIADFTGLRVETVIRALIKLEKENRLQIVHHKVYY
jgi:CRP-like cAMP-binding protein